MNSLSARSLGLIGLIFFFSCSHTRPGDRELSSNEVPSFLKESGKDFKEAEYFEKTFPDGRKIYEVKEDEGQEISITLDEKGNFLEREEDISVHDLDQKLSAKILSYIEREYQGARIIEWEKRKTNKDSFIDVEIKHDSSPSGYWELSFDEHGAFVSKEVENYETPMTHN